MWRLMSGMSAGEGAFDTVVADVRKRGIKSVLALIDGALAPQSAVGAAVDALAAVTAVTLVHRNSPREPTYDELDKLAEEHPGPFEAIVGIGGGSTLDLAKGLSILQTNPGPSLKYRGSGQVGCLGTPLYLAPSTAGSGSEATPNAAYVEASENRKMGIVTEMFDIRHVALDPAFVRGCPGNVVLSSGVDALCHTLEGFTSRLTNPFAQQLAKFAFENLVVALPRAVSKDVASDPDIWTSLLLGSYFGGAALINSSAGIAGAFSYPLGELYGLPHGVASGIPLVHVVRFNINRGYLGYDSLTPALASQFPEAGTEDFAALFERLLGEVGCPFSLPGSVRGRSSLDEVMTSLDRVWGAIDNNPVTPTREDITAMARDMGVD